MNPLSQNLYTYVGNNPLIRFDPSGNSWVSDLWNNGVNGAKAFGNRMWYDFTHIDQRAMEVIDFLVIDDARTILDPNASSLSKAMAYAGLIPIGKVTSLSKKMFVEVMNAGKKIQAEVSSALIWKNYHKHDLTSIKGYKKMTWSDIRATTKNGAAMYKTGINIESLERYAWEFGTPVTNGKTWKVMRFEEVIGATSGKDTKYMRVEITNGDTIHGHPITEQEFKNLLK